MILLPWYIRFSIDCFITTAPFVYIHYHPTLIFQYFANNRRIARRRSFDEIIVKPNPKLAIEETKKLYNQLGMEI